MMKVRTGSFLLAWIPILLAYGIAGADTPTLEIPRNPPPDLESLPGGPENMKGRVTEFRQRDPRDGIPASRKTTAVVSYDEKNLYVIFVCEDEPEQIRAHL